VSSGYGPWLGGVGRVGGLAVPHEAHEVGPRSLRGVAGYMRYPEGLRGCVGAVGGVPVAGRCPWRCGRGRSAHEVGPRRALGVWGGVGVGGNKKAPQKVSEGLGRLLHSKDRAENGHGV